MKLALSNILARKGRTAISILVVGVGIMTLLTLVGMTQGTIREVAERMQNVDADMLVHARAWNPVIDIGTAPLERRYEGLLREIEGVKDVTPVAVGRIILLNQGHNFFAINPEDFDRVAGFRKIIKGRDLKDGFELLLDERLAKAGNFKVGQKLKRLGKTFTIVGICQSGVPVRVFMPLSTAQREFIKEDRVSYFFIKCDSPDEIGQVASRIESAFPSLEAMPLGNYYQALQGSFRGLHQFITGVTSVSMGVSFLVILLAMYTAVLERTRQIGILKSLSASRFFIMRSVFAESLMISAAGVLAGMALAIVAKFAIEVSFPLLTVDLNWGQIAVAALLGVVGGLLGALYPALRASRLDPVVALRYE